MQYREGTAEQFTTAKETETLNPKSFYLIDGKPHLALTESTAFTFVDHAMVLQIIAGLSLGGDGESGLALGTTSGRAPTTTGTAGTSNLAAREDHTHPTQTNILGNANTATSAQSANKLTSPRTIRLTGAVTGSGQFGGDADCTIQTLSGEQGSDAPHWFGTRDQLPPESERDSRTVYMVYEFR